MQVSNIECVAPDRIKFDFLGKDSMRYENETAVHPKVFELMKRFCNGELRLPLHSALCGPLSMGCICTTVQ